MILFGHIRDPFLYRCEIASAVVIVDILPKGFRLFLLLIGDNGGIISDLGSDIIILGVMVAALVLVNAGLNFVVYIVAPVVLRDTRIAGAYTIFAHEFRGEVIRIERITAPGKR